MRRVRGSSGNFLSPLGCWVRTLVGNSGACLGSLGDAFAEDFDLDIAMSRVECDRHDFRLSSDSYQSNSRIGGVAPVPGRISMVPDGELRRLFPWEMLTFLEVRFLLAAVKANCQRREDQRILESE